MIQNVTTEFIDKEVNRLEENTPKIKKCLDEVIEQEIRQSPNASSNRVGNIILHIFGNITK
jgi:hypothetical protein